MRQHVGSMVLRRSRAGNSSGMTCLLPGSRSLQQRQYPPDQLIWIRAVYTANGEKLQGAYGRQLYKRRRIPTTISTTIFLRSPPHHNENDSLYSTD
ncbi:uncharacterized protein ACN427_014723 [Glossina fuscipes fuscipes]